MNDKTNAHLPNAIVLGGTVPHASLCEKLKNKGYHTILIDYRDNPPAKSIADEHVKISTLDYEQVLEMAQKRKAHIVISVCVDQANVIACRVSEELGLPHPYSSETGAVIADKVTMKERLINCHIPTAKFTRVSSDGVIKLEDLTFPLVVKPADSNSGNKVKIVQTEEELLSSVGDALNFSRNGEVIIEEYMRGKEISAYFFVGEDNITLLSTSEKFNIEAWEDRVQKNHTAVMPAVISDKAEREVIRIGGMVADAFHLKNVPIILQAVIDGDRVRVIEFAPRLGGGACFETLFYRTGIDVLEAALDSWMEYPVNVGVKNQCKIITVIHVYAQNGVYSHVTGVDAIMKMPQVLRVEYDRTPGELTDIGRASSSKICYFLLQTDTRDEIASVIDDIYNVIDVIDVSGNSILDREVRYQVQLPSSQ